MPARATPSTKRQRPRYLKTPKGTVALVAIASGLVAEGGSATSTRPGVNELRVDKGTPNVEDAQRILASIRAARTKADLVIVYEHNHVFGDVPFTTMMIEELPERLRPAEWLKKWTHAEVDAGADIIVMHGAPLVHGVEIYRGRPIFSDLGNFIFQFPPSRGRWTSRSSGRAWSPRSSSAARRCSRSSSVRSRSTSWGRASRT